MNGSSAGVSTTRLYGALIAFASGGYSVLVGASGSTTRAWLMLLLGAVVVLHGAVLLTSWADRLGDASGPLMVAYALLMLANQGWMAAMAPTGGMDGGMDAGMGGEAIGSAAGLGWDPGMVVLALLMLASGAVMLLRDDGM